MLRLPHLLAASLLIPLPAAAQITGTMKLDSDAGVYASAGNQDDFDADATGTPVPPSQWTWRLGAQASSGSGATAISASQSVWGNCRATNGGNMGMTGLLRGTPSDTTHLTPSTSKNGTPGAIAFLGEMQGPANRTGVLRLSWQTLFKYSATAQATVDVDNDSTIDWTGTDTQGGVKGTDLPAAFDANGKLVFRITMSGSMAGAGQFVYSSVYTRLAWSFVEPINASCTVTAYGQGCQGVQATGVVTPFPNHHLISLQVTGGFPNGFVVETVGNQSMNLPLLGSCALLSNALVLLVRQADAQGSYSHSYQVSKFTGSMSYHQYLPIELQGNALVIKASNGLKINCIAAR
jgi:hypothetical protein